MVATLHLEGVVSLMIQCFGMHMHCLKKQKKYMLESYQQILILDERIRMFIRSQVCISVCGLHAYYYNVYILNLTQDDQLNLPQMQGMTSKIDQEQLQLMASNLKHLQHHLSQNQPLPTSSDHLLQVETLSPSPQETPHNEVSNAQQLIAAIRQQYEQHKLKHPIPQNHEQKLQRILQSPLTIPNSVILFEMLYYFREAIEQSIIEQIQQKVFDALVESFSYQNQRQVQCFCEVLALCGVESEEVCQFMAEVMVEEIVNFQLAFFVLSNQGLTGLVYLMDIANRNIVQMSNKILDYLSRSEQIVSAIIVPALLQDALDQNLTRHRDISLAALNRLAPCLSQPSKLNDLISLLHDNNIDKKLLLSTLRCSGLNGQQLLLDLIKSKQLNENAMCLALGTLSWRIPEKSALRIKTMEYTLDHCFLPGRLYQYEGTLQPWNYQEDHCSDTLCLSSRDFLSHLQLYIKEYQPRYFSRCNIHLSLLSQVLNLQESSHVQLSQEVIMALTSQLRNKSMRIREVALLQLGNIGVQASSALNSVQKCLNDPDSTIRSAACWTLARICTAGSKKLESKITEMLRDSFWKVRTSACIALGLIVKQPQVATIEALIKVLQDGSIPKPVICQTLARIGAEQLLIEILKGTNRNDFKLRQAIISSFEFSTLKSPLLNSIVEELLKYSRDSRFQIRQLCLLTLSSLRQKVQQENCQEKISYFQGKHLLPFYYCFLDDPSQKIRGIAAQNILSFGPQAQLLFIQGMTKGQPLAKIECIRCLGQLGVQNFRAIILGLRDQDERVRRAASDTILDNFTAEQIIQEFKRKENHSISLICNLKEILNQNNQDAMLKQMVKDILVGLQGQPKCFSPTTVSYQNKCPNKQS